MAEAAITAALRCAGAHVDEDGSIGFPSHFFVDGLASNFGVFALQANGNAVYFLRSLTEVAETHTHDTDPFHDDVRRAVRRVQDGTSYAIILCAIVEGDAFTKLCVCDR